MEDEEFTPEIPASQKLAIGQARRRMCRNIAAAIVAGMAATDSDIGLISIRMGQSEDKVRRLINRLIDGKSIQLDQVSDLLFAMGLELEMRLVKAVPVASPEGRIPVSQIEEEPSGDDTDGAEQPGGGLTPPC